MKMPETDGDFNDSSSRKPKSSRLWSYAFSVAYQHKAHVNQAEDRHVRKKCNNSLLKRKDPQILSH